MYYVRLLIGLCCLAYNIFGGVDPLKSSGSSTPTFFELSILLDEGTITYDEYTELKEAIQNPESNCDLLTLYFDQVKECESIFTIQRMLIAHEIAYELAQDSGHSNRSTGVIKEEHLEAKVRYDYENNGNTYRNGMYQQKWWSVGVGNSTVRSLIHTFSAIRVLGGSGHRSPLFSGKRYLNGIYGSYGNSSYGGISYSVTGESTDKGVVYDRSSLVQFQGDIGLIKVNPLLIAGHLYTSDYSTSHRYVYGGLEVEYNAITPFIYVSPATHGYRVGAKIKRNEKPYRYTLYGVYRSARFEGPHLQGLSYVKDTLWGVLYTAQGEELLVRYTQAYARKQYSITHSGVLVSGGDVCLLYTSPSPRD